jgi:aspartyl-tRNA(Asn)/glutamyl-tRNA(Gln) amidotransferase subunit C
MAVSVDDVRRIATLANLRISDERTITLVAELNGILSHIELLSRANVGRSEPVTGVGSEGAPLAADAGPPMVAAFGVETLAPLSRDGFILVPKLSTHDLAADDG